MVLVTKVTLVTGLYAGIMSRKSMASMGRLFYGGVLFRVFLSLKTFRTIYVLAWSP